MIKFIGVLFVFETTVLSEHFIAKIINKNLINAMCNKFIKYIYVDYGSVLKCI